MELHEEMVFILLLCYIFIYACTNAIFFSKTNWKFTKEERKKQLHNCKKNILIFFICMLFIPFLIFPVRLLFTKQISLIEFIIVCVSISFGPPLSGQIFKYYKITKNNKSWLTDKIMSHSYKRGGSAQPSARVGGAA